MYAVGWFLILQDFRHASCAHTRVLLTTLTLHNKLFRLLCHTSDAAFYYTTPTIRCILLYHTNTSQRVAAFIIPHQTPCVFDQPHACVHTSLVSVLCYCCSLRNFLQHQVSRPHSQRQHSIALRSIATLAARTCNNFNTQPITSLARSLRSHEHHTTPSRKNKFLLNQQNHTARR